MSHPKDDIDTSMIALIGILSAILTFAIIVFVMIWYENVKQYEFERKVVAAKPAELSLLNSEQQEMINAYRWVNEASQTVAVPIDLAKQLVIQENQ
jgi:nitrogen fixation-related uncharacterized protein